MMPSQVRKMTPNVAPYRTFMLSPQHGGPSWLAYIAKAADPVKWAAAQARLREARNV